MGDFDAVIRTRVLSDGDVVERCIGIADGRISAVKKAIEAPDIIEFSKYVAMPGGVDVHTHMREPGFTQKEDFYTGTLAAAFGGTTAVLDMPNTRPFVDGAGALEEKLELVSGRANVDFGLVAALTSANVIPGLGGKAIGLKLFLAGTTDAPGATEPQGILESGALAGRVVTVHAEDEGLYARLPDTCTEAHNIVRNMEAEISAVEKVLACNTRATLNLAHLTTTESVGMAKASGVRFELAPHHLLLHDAMELGALGKVNPPLRHRDVAKALFDLFRGGEGDIVASDHAPHTLDEKGRGFEAAPSGVPGVETRMPLLMAMAVRGDVTLDTVQETCCQNPAGLFGMNKGRIAEGFDADLAFYDPGDIVKIRGEELHSKCGWTPFEDFDGLFPASVMLRGRFIIRDRELVAGKAGRPL